MRSLKIDHVTLACSSLELLRRDFDSLGLETAYGGAHSNGITHMALLAFADGSYIELISHREPGAPTQAVWWSQAMLHDAGPCGWAVEVEDVAAEAQRIAAKGIPVDGPHYFYRKTPGGLVAEWDLAFIGHGEPGAVLPFIIKDITPREHRVSPATAVFGGRQPALLSGVAAVVLAVQDLESGVDLFKRAYDWPEPLAGQDPAFGADLAHFDETPVILATPLEDDNWLARRLQQFGDSPCAYLLGCSSLEQAASRFPLTPPAGRFGHGIAWLAKPGPQGARLGLVE